MKNSPPKTRGQRDSRVELLRLFACFSVLILHFKPSTFLSGRPVLSRIFLTCVSTDAVGIFLLITGFFFFGSQPYSTRIKSYIKKIFIPTIAYTVFVAVIYPLLIGASIDTNNVINEFIITITTWNPIIHNAQHLWYMYLYGMIIAVSPLLLNFKNKILTNDKRKLVFITFSLVFLAINDLLSNSLLHCEMKPVTVFIPGCIFVVVGGIIYEERHRMAKNLLLAVFSLGGFICINIGRSVYMHKALGMDVTLTHMYGWYTSIGFICAIALAVFVLCIPDFVSRLVNILAGNTMDIYILHVIVSEIVSVMGYKTWIINTFLNGSESFGQYVLFTGIYSLSIFIFCTAIAMVCKAPLKLLKKSN